jgi:hypothetical protein
VFVAVFQWNALRETNATTDKAFSLTAHLRGAISKIF